MMRWDMFMSTNMTEAASAKREIRTRSESRQCAEAASSGSMRSSSAGLDEVIEFKHTAYSRSVFGKGAVEAAKFLAGKKAGFYDMQDVIRATMEQAD